MGRDAPASRTDVANGDIPEPRQLRSQLQAGLGNFLGHDQHVGGFAGCEVELVRDVFDFEADWDAGAHALGSLSLGPRVHLGKCCALSSGAQIPNAWGSASYRALAQFELTYPGKQE